MTNVAAVRLFEQEPDLLRVLPEVDRPRAERFAVVPAVRVATGAFDPVSLGASQWGALVLDGLVAREVTVAGTSAAELLGAGDVILAMSSTPDELLTSTGRWTVLDQLTVALLEDRFQALVRHWPELGACLLERSERRAARLAVAQAISHLTRVDTRVLVMLWTLASRWGRVGTDGIVVPLRLTHRTLARLVGARRPSVTTAITELHRRSLIARRDDGSWLLHGPPPEELERVGIDRILPTPAPVRRPAPAVSDASEAAAAPLPVEAGASASVRDVHRRLQSTVAQVRQLAEAYERQSERTREISRRTRDTRARARALRGEIAAARERA